MAAFIPFRVENGWAIHIEPETKTVWATKDTPCRTDAVRVEFTAKSTKQAWFAYYNPFKAYGFLKGYAS